jgi:hypothetical protein
LLPAVTARRKYIKRVESEIREELRADRTSRNGKTGRIIFLGRGLG